MHYLVWGGDAGALRAAAPRDVAIVADGDMIVLEGPWPLGQTTLASVADASAFAALKSVAAGAAKAFAVEAMRPPGDGHAFVVAAHKMLDPEGFRPYAEAIPDVLERFNARSLARGGAVTPIAGDFVPDRGVVLEFESVEAAVAFYTSEVYAPLLDLRLRTTDPRFVVIARSGPIGAAVRHAAEAFLKAQGR